MNTKDQAIFEEEGIDLRRWFLYFLRYWKIFLACIMIALTVVSFFLMFSPRQYEISAQILVRKEKNPLDKDQIFNTVLYDPYQIENEKGILHAKSVTRNALRKLDFYTGYFESQKFRMKELYNQTPFVIIKDSAHLQPLDVLFMVHILNDTLIVVKSEGQNVRLYDFSKESIVKTISTFRYSDTVKFGQITGNSFCRFSFMPSLVFLSKANPHKTYFFRFYSIDELIRTYRNLKIENEKTSSIIKISFRSFNPEKAADFLNSFTSEYLRKGIEHDNNKAEATIKFIDAQLIDIVDSLHQSSERLQVFKSNNKVLDISFQAEKVYNKIEELEAEKAKLLVKSRYFSYLLEKLTSKSEISDLIVPGTIDINDPVINKLIQDLTELYGERAELSFNSIKDNPYISSLELKLNDVKQKLAEAAHNLLDATKISIEETDAQIQSADQVLNQLPKEQQKFLSIDRKFKLNDELYTYLLTRRSEMEIFKASNLPANELLDAADPRDAALVSPNKKVSIMLALLLGIIFPAGILYMRDTMDNKLRSRQDIQKYTDLPIVGHIVDSSFLSAPAVINEPHSTLSESYRSMRTNLQFIIDEATSNIILITSAWQGEGKSFTAMNLAAIYSFYGKKSVLVDFDLRRSSIKEGLELKTEVGLSNYLSKNIGFDKIIQHDDKINFDLIIAGPVPPNPSELVASKLTKELFQKLKESYDIIIVDSPPLGIVSDAINLYQYADVALLVVRYNYSRIEIFEETLEDLKTKNIEKVNIVLNDIKISKSRYGYGYDYGYKYSWNPEKNSGNWFSRSRKET